MRLLLDEMYPVALAKALRDRGIEASTAVELGISGSSDPVLLQAAIDRGCILLTENVADFARIAADQLIGGNHHCGVLIALSSRFSRRPAGIPRIAAAVEAVVTEELGDRTVYLKAPKV